MVKKSKGTQKKSRNISRSRRFVKDQFQRVIAGLAVLLFLVLIVGVMTHQFVLKKEKLGSGGNTMVTGTGDQGALLFEIFPSFETPTVKPLEKTKPSTAEALPKVAVIIDDIGYDRNLAQKFIDLDVLLTFSLLPNSPFAVSIAREIHRKGAETMLHLPMEPNEYPQVNPGPGTLFTSMSPDALIRQLEENIDAVPFIKGVNNHMGSKMTTVSSQMYQIFSILKKRGLFFIDSRTTSDSLCKPSAKLLKILFAERDVFLDHVHDREFIRRQINRLVYIAQHRGQAVGIAHPNAMTYDVLRQMLPELKDKVRIVPASEIVQQVG